MYNDEIQSAGIRSRCILIAGTLNEVSMRRGKITSSRVSIGSELLFCIRKNGVHALLDGHIESLFFSGAVLFWMGTNHFGLVSGIGAVFPQRLTLLGGHGGWSPQNRWDPLVPCKNTNACIRTHVLVKQLCLTVVKMRYLILLRCPQVDTTYFQFQPVLKAAPGLGRFERDPLPTSQPNRPQREFVLHATWGHEENPQGQTLVNVLLHLSKPSIIYNGSLLKKAQ